MVMGTCAHCGVELRVRARTQTLPFHWMRMSPQTRSPQMIPECDGSNQPPATTRVLLPTRPRAACATCGRLVAVVKGTGRLWPHACLGGVVGGREATTQTRRTAPRGILLRS